MGGAAGGELSIAGGSSSLSAGEERISKYDVNVDGGYDNPNWPTELDEQLVQFLNEKASEHRKHPRNIRSSSLLNEDSQIVLTPGPAGGAAGAADAGEPDEAGPARGERRGSEYLEAGARMPEEVGAGGGGDGEGRGGADAGNVSGLSLPGAGGLWEWEGGGASITGSTPSASPALRPSPASRRLARGLTPVALSTSFDPADFDFLEEEEAGAADEERKGKGGSASIRASSGVGSRSASAVRARFVVLKKLESLVAAALPLVNLSVAYEPDSAAGRLSAVKGRLFEATKTHLWDAAIRLTQVCQNS